MSNTGAIACYSADEGTFAKETAGKQIGLAAAKPPAQARAAHRKQYRGDEVDCCRPANILEAAELYDGHR